MTFIIKNNKRNYRRKTNTVNKTKDNTIEQLILQIE